jgi:hypothetical protein
VPARLLGGTFQGSDKKAIWGGYDLMLPVGNRRPRRRILCNFVIALVLAVAGREVPECANLGDDVSNDGVVSCVHAAVSKARARRLTLSEVVRLHSASTFGDRLPISGFLADRASKGGRDLLQLLTLQRK